MRAGFRRARGEWAVNFDIDYFSGRVPAARHCDSADDADVVLASKRAAGSDDRRSAVPPARNTGLQPHPHVALRIIGQRHPRHEDGPHAR